VEAVNVPDDPLEEVGPKVKIGCSTLFGKKAAAACLNSPQEGVKEVRGMCKVSWLEPGKDSGWEGVLWNTLLERFC